MNTQSMIFSISAVRTDMNHVIRTSYQYGVIGGVIKTMDLTSLIGVGRLIFTSKLARFVRS